MHASTYFVYILTNTGNSVLYVGVTNNLIRRVYEHKQHLVDGFAKKYKLTKLVYYEEYSDSVTAIEREKQIKGGSRSKKVQLIESKNPMCKDLYGDLL